MNRKKITRAAWILVSALLVLLLIYTQQMHRKTICTEIVVEIENELSESFLTGEQVLNHLNSLNNTMIGKNIHDIDLITVRKQVMKLPYVANADAIFAMNGVMKIRIIQRTPIVKVFDKNLASIYIANDGLVMPVNAEKNLRLPLITSDIHDSILRLTGKNIHQLSTISMLREAFLVADFIRTDTLLKALVPHIHINKNKEIEIIPSIDDHTVLLGNSDSLAYKFKKLITFYQRGMVRTGWDIYESINLKYGNQVICTRKP